MTLTDLQALLRLTLTNPRAAARAIMALNLPDAVGWTALLAVAAVTTVLGFVGQSSAPGEMPEPFASLMSSPMRMAGIQLISLLVTVVLAWVVGRRFGGQGSFADTLALVAWVQVPLVLLQLLQLVAMQVLVPLAPLLGLASLALYAVLLSQVLAELHGFRSALLVFGGIIATSLVAAIPVAILILALFGAPANV